MLDMVYRIEKLIPTIITEGIEIHPMIITHLKPELDLW